MFGVTPEVVSSWVNGLVFRDAAVGPPAVQATSPSRAECLAEIQFASIRVAGLFTRLGAAVPTDPNTDSYVLARDLVLLRITSWADRSRQRVDPDLAQVRAEEEQRLIAEIEANTARIGDARGTGDRSPGLARTQDQPYRSPVGIGLQGASLWRSGGV